jgi:sugar O-acyltransferase (sialic acid O-acetyltransferase NeuD family)
MLRLILFGPGGFGRELLRAARHNYEDVVFGADDPGPPVMGAPVLTPGEFRDDDELVVAIGNPAVRRRIVDRFPALKLGSVRAPTAIIGDEVEIGPGAVFCDFTMVTASARIGANFQCNIYSYVAHDCIIGDDVTFAPQVCCNGNVHIGDGAYIGTGAVVNNGTADKPLIIGAGAVVGSGAVVTKDVPPNAVVVGNPARPLERKAPGSPTG